MKKTILILTVLLTGFKVFANPIIPPPIISEIYFDSLGYWYIEINPNYCDFQNFDGMKIYTSTDTAEFKQGINISENDSVIIITQDSLISRLLIINKDSDFIKISDGMRYSFGNYSNSGVQPIIGDYSYEMVKYRKSFYYEYGDEYFFVINTPSIGIIHDYGFIHYIHPLYPLNANAYGTFIYQVVDADSILIHNHSFNLEYWPDNWNYTYENATDTINLFCCKFHISLSDDNSYHIDTTLFINPDSTVIYTFVLNITKDELIKKQDINIKTYPNPAKDKINIKFNLENYRIAKTAVIKLFSIKGDLLKIIPVNTSNLNTEQNISIDVSDLSSGNYYYNLEIDSKKIATEKIIISK